MEIGGPGLVRSGGGFTGGGFGLSGAVEGMAIAAVLNAMTTRTSIKTVVRIQGTGCELFLLHTRLTPEQLRIEMSRTLAVIRAARADQAAARSSSEARPGSSVTGRGTGQAGRHAGKRPANPRGIRLDESQDPRVTGNLIRRSMEMSVQCAESVSAGQRPTSVRHRRHGPVPSGQSVRKL